MPNVQETSERSPVESGVKRVKYTSSRRLILNCRAGLGNQIFEYAAGLFFAKRASIPLEIVQPVLKNQQWGGFPLPFQLNAFSVDENVRTATTTDRFFLSSSPRLRFLRNELRSISGTQTIEESADYRFFPDLLDTVNARTIYLSGYWQAAEYAEGVADQLRSSLRLRDTPQQQNLGYAEAIRGLACPVSLHVRLGDYALHSNANTRGPAKVSLVLQRSYFHAAIARMRSLLPDASFVVFSDDQVSAREILAGEPVSLWVEGNDSANAYEDLWLMSCCKHHIVANSSFSWWGAWLNPSPEKIVLAPKYWGNTHHSYFPDLYPSSWIPIDNLA
jgi:hypothetical protein